MLKQRVAQKIGNGRGTRVTAVPTLMYSPPDISVDGNERAG
jgi:hypothetical protein